MERQESSHQLFKTIKQDKKISQEVGGCKNSNSSLYNNTTKSEKFRANKIQSGAYL